MLLAFNKPWGVLSQFSDKGQGSRGRPTLSDFIDIPSVYPAGRLDRDSEGLMLLTDDGKLQQRISNPKHGSQKQYLVQVEGIPDVASLKLLKQGVQLKDGMARALGAELLARKPGWLWPRIPPIRERRNIPDSWMVITLSEGRNRQVRRMTAAVGLPTLRLVRMSIGKCSLDGLEPGKWRKEEVW